MLCRRHGRGVALAVWGLLLLAVARLPAAAADPVRVLLLDYNARDEHDVLQSFLCVEPCAPGSRCPESLRREGVDYWSEDFAVFRPPAGRTVSLVDRFRDADVDLLSLSGHHASGFSGTAGGPRFDTERLGAELERELGVGRFFVHPAMVLLQGCRTDVKSSFEGDPREYILHVIEETQVRRHELDRLLAAVQQIGGVQQAYRDLFPNACILGYAGTQAPGGRFEIYFQVSGWLRSLAARSGGEPTRRFDPLEVRGSTGAFAALNRRIEAECPGGWPCNLCRRAPEHYAPLAKALASQLRGDRRRLQGGGRDPRRAAELESELEAGSFYNNTKWSCSAGAPVSEPTFPTPVDESPFARMFVELLLIDYGELSESERSRLREELVQRLGTIELEETDRGGLDDWLSANQDRVGAFIRGPLLSYSTFRQRDLFRFLARAGCAPCFASVFRPESPLLLRENAASSLEPMVGAGPYRWALADPDARVRRAAAGRLDPSLPPEILELARRDPDPAVRAAAGGR